MANREAFQSLLQKFRASSKRSLTTAPRGNATSSGFSAHWVENSPPHCLHFTRGRIRFFLVCPISFWQWGHSNSTGIRMSCVSVVR